MTIGETQEMIKLFFAIIMELRAELSATQCERDLSTLITECSCTLTTLPEEVLHPVDAKCTRRLKLYTDPHGKRNSYTLNGYKECLELHMQEGIATGDG